MFSILAYYFHIIKSSLKTHYSLISISSNVFYYIRYIVPEPDLLIVNIISVRLVSNNVSVGKLYLVKRHLFEQLLHHSINNK